MYVGPNIVRDGLVLALDAASSRSYPGSGTTWYDLSGNDFHFTLDGSGISYGYSTDIPIFSLADGGATYSGVITNNTTCTFVFWIQTTDTQAVFWKGQTSSEYLGAYRVTNKEYYNNFGTPDYYQDTVEESNIYDNVRDSNWHMVEFKNVDMSGITSNEFNQYSPNYTFGNGSIGLISIYNRNLTSEESAQNYNAFRNRFRLSV